RLGRSGVGCSSGSTSIGAEGEEAGSAGVDHDHRKAHSLSSRDPWNKGLLIGQKRPFEAKGRLDNSGAAATEGHQRDIAMFNLAIDSKLRGCDLVRVRIDDVRAGLDSSAYGTYSLRRTKPAQIYSKTGNLRAVQLLLGHTKLESTVRYLGIE